MLIPKTTAVVKYYVVFLKKDLCVLNTNGKAWLVLFYFRKHEYMGFTNKVRYFVHIPQN